MLLHVSLIVRLLNILMSEVSFKLGSSPSIVLIILTGGAGCSLLVVAISLLLLPYPITLVCGLDIVGRSLMWLILHLFELILVNTTVALLVCLVA